MWIGCPICRIGILKKQTQSMIVSDEDKLIEVPNVEVCVCSNCKNITIPLNEKFSMNERASFLFDPQNIPENRCIKCANKLTRILKSDDGYKFHCTRCNERKSI